MQKGGEGNEKSFEFQYLRDILHHEGHQLSAKKSPGDKKGAYVRNQNPQIHEQLKNQQKRKLPNLTAWLSHTLQGR